MSQGQVTKSSETIIEGAHLKRRPHQNRHLVQRNRRIAARAALIAFDLFANPARLFLPVPDAGEAELFAVIRLRPQFLAQPVGIAANDICRRGQDLRGRPVILLQPHHMRAFKIFFEPQDVAHFGTAPAIDRLIVIADATDVLVPTRQQPQPQRLETFLEMLLDVLN